VKDKRGKGVYRSPQGAWAQCLWTGRSN